jgi:membrane-associated phospholipid phosphatase
MQQQAAWWQWSAAGLGVLVLLCLLVDHPLQHQLAALSASTRRSLGTLTQLGDAKWYLLPLGLLVPVLFVLGRHWRRRRWAALALWLAWAGLFVFLAIASSGILVNLLKVAIGRARPKLTEAYGPFEFEPFTLDSDFAAFPSGHASTLLALAAALACLLPRLRLTLLAFATWCAITRLFIGAHFLTDVLAGGALGVLAAHGCRRLLAERRWLFARAADGAIMLRGGRLWRWLGGGRRRDVAAELPPAAMAPAMAWRALQATLLLSLVFLALPQLDLWASALVFDAATGTFAGSGSQALRGLVKLCNSLVIALGLAALGTLLLRLAAPRRAWLDARAALFLVLALLLGPVLVTNLLLKDQWGRPRPHQVVEFGGSQHFQPAWVPSAQCARNCSFVSGDASAAFWLLAPAVCLAGRWRRAALAGASAMGVAVGAARFLVGAHFLSDVILAGLLTYLVTWLCHWLICQWASPFAWPGSIAAWLDRRRVSRLPWRGDPASARARTG